MSSAVPSHPPHFQAHADVGSTMAETPQSCTVQYPSLTPHTRSPRHKRPFFGSEPICSPCVSPQHTRHSPSHHNFRMQSTLAPLLHQSGIVLPPCRKPEAPGGVINRIRTPGTPRLESRSAAWSRLLFGLPHPGDPGGGSLISWCSFYASRYFYPAALLWIICFITTSQWLR